MKQHDLQHKFETLWRIIGGPELQTEYRFHPVRRWRFDYAAPANFIGIELEGGVWKNGRHTRGRGYVEDCIKYNAAQFLGWRVFRLTTDMLDNAPAQHLGPIRDLINDH